MKQKQLKTNVLKKQVITKIKERVERAKKSGVDMEVVKKQLIKALKERDEKRTVTLLEKIASHSDHQDLVAIMTQVEKTIAKNKVAFPKAFEVVQTMKPKWYVAPHEEVSIKNTVKVEGSVKTEVDAGYWTAFGAVLGVAMSGLFEYLNKFAQKTFRVMPAKEHYTTPQMVVIADPKTGRPVSLKDIGQSGGQTIVQVTGGRSSSQSGSGTGVDPVGLKNTSGTPVNPATQDTLALVLAQLEAIEANTDNLEITAENVNLNTDALEGKIDETNTRIGEVSATPTANTVQDRLKSIKTVLDALLAATDSLEANTTGLATQVTLASVLSAVDGIEASLSTLITQTDALEANTTGLATQTTLASVLTAVDGIEALLTTLNSQTDAVEASLTTIAGYLDTVETKLQSLIDQGPSEILKATIDLTASGDIITPTAGQKLRVYAIKFSLSADMTSASFNFGASAAFEKYLNPKGGGLYGTNVAPNYIQGGTDEKLKLVLVGTGTVTINVDYKIVP